MAHLKNKTIREFNEKDLQDRLRQTRTELFKLNVESKKGTLRKESGKLKPLRNLLISKRSYNELGIKLWQEISDYQ